MGTTRMLHNLSNEQKNYVCYFFHLIQGIYSFGQYDFNAQFFTNKSKTFRSNFLSN